MLFYYVKNNCRLFFQKSFMLCAFVFCFKVRAVNSSVCDFQFRLRREILSYRISVLLSTLCLHPLFGFYVVFC